MKKKGKKNKLKFPKELIILDNPDKGFFEKWKSCRDMLNIPHPYRCVLLGKPNSGKGLVVKNLILRADPEFERIVLIHCDVDYTKEWDDVEPEKLAEVPDPEEFNGEEKTLVILDDLEYKSMSKDHLRRLDRLFGYVSTHKHVSCVLLNQDAFAVPPTVRRCSNLWILWKQDDVDALCRVARKTGMKAEDFRYIFDNIVTQTHDSLWIDMTNKSPYPLRKNGYTILSAPSDIHKHL